MIARKFGSNLDGAGKQTRILNLALLTLIAVLIKTLVDKGLITDAELTATLNAARDDLYADEPTELPPPDVL